MARGRLETAVSRLARRVVVTAADRDDRRIWRWLWTQIRPFAVYQAGSLSLVLVASLLNAVGPLLMRWLIDDVLPNRRTPLLFVVTVSLLAAHVGGVALSSASRTINKLGVLRLVHRMRMRLLTHLQALPETFYRAHPVGDLVRRVEEDVELVGQFGSEILPAMARVGAQSGVTIGVMLFLDWRLTAIIGLLLPIYVCLRNYYRTSLMQSSQDVREASGRRTSYLNDLLTAAIQIQMLGAERQLSRRYSRLNLRGTREQWLQHNREVYFVVATLSVIGLGTALIVGYGGWRVMTGDLTAGTFVAFYGYVAFIFSPLVIATELYAQLNRVRASITRLIDIERSPRQAWNTPEAVPITAAPARVTCDGVTFGYAPDAAVLTDAHVEAHAGERILLVGASGCGKSSLLKLIARLYDVDGGRVVIGERDVRTIDLRSLRAAVSLVPQEPILFQGTLRDNLRYGSHWARADRLDLALWIACLDDVVANLPKGLDTELGPAGCGLSVGEKQRLALARAIVQDRPILLLDEATSALDARTERQFYERITPWCADRIVILVSHRASAYQWADRVLLLENGSVRERRSALPERIVGASRDSALPGNDSAAIERVRTSTARS